MSDSGKNSRVLITGVGHVVSPLFGQALDGKRAAPPEVAPEITGFETAEGAPAFGFETPDFQIEDYLPKLKTYVDPTSAFALAAAQEALKDAGLLDEAHRPDGLEVGCAYGTTMGCLEAMGIFWKKVKSGNPKFAPPLPFTHSYANSPSSLLCIEYGLRGAAATFSGERLAGVEALLFGVDQIAAGSAEAVLVGASESLNSAVHTHLFSESRLSASGRCAAWSGENDGVVPGEGGAFVLLESEASAGRRGAFAYAELAAIGLGTGSAVSPFLEAWDRAGESALRAFDVGAGPALVVAATPDEPGVDQWEQAFWTQRLAKAGDVAVVAPKLFTGELMSASPIVGLLLAARVLGGKLDGSGLPGAIGLGEAGTSRAAEGPFALAFAGAFDPLAAAGIMTLRKHM